jgi:hypothetical protein
LQLRKPQRVLSRAVLVNLHDENRTEAWVQWRALGLLLGHFRYEPTLFSQLVRFAMVSAAVPITWEALQFPGWQAEQLAELQAAWESFDLLDTLEAVMAMERAIGEKVFADVREKSTLFLDTVSMQTPSSPSGSVFDDLAEVGQKFAEDPGGSLAELRDRTTRYWAWRWWYSYHEELMHMRQWGAGIEAAKQMKATRSLQPAARQLEEALAALAKREGTATNSFILLSADGSTVKNFLQKAARTETHRNLVVTVLALERYRLRHGAYPPALSALVPELLRKTPRDFMDGQPLRYRANDDGTFLLYSIGDDGKDDGGDSTPTKNRSPVSFWNGRDYVWPAAAKPEEVAAAEKKKRK